MKYLRYTYLKILFIFYLKCKFNWVSLFFLTTLSLSPKGSAKAQGRYVQQNRWGGPRPLSCGFTRSRELSCPHTKWGRAGEDIFAKTKHLVTRGSSWSPPAKTCHLSGHYGHGA